MTTSTAVPFNYNLIWTEYKSGVGTHILSWVFAIGIHLPLLFMRLDMHKAHTYQDHDKLLGGIEVIDKIPEKPAVAPPPAPAVKKNGWADKLAQLVKRAPPPPPPPVVKPVEPPVPAKLDTGPKQIELKPKLDALAQIKPKESKSGFTASDLPKNLQDKKIDLKSNNNIIAPLSASKFNMQDKGPSKISKQSFQVASTEKLSSLGGSGSLADPSAPTIAINTGRTATSEGFSKPSPQLANKSGFQSSSGGSFNSNNLTMREKAMINAAGGSTQIAMGDSKFGKSGGVEGGVPGGTGAASDRGHYSGGGMPGGVAGGVSGGVVGGTGSSLAGIKSGTGVGGGGTTVRKDKPMFQITGPLKDRPIERKVNPEYPAWAQSQGISASVVIEFTVDNSGVVKDLMVVIRTSGYPKLDQSAMKTLLQWKFAPLADGNTQDQVGRITFNYQLN